MNYLKLFINDQSDNPPTPVMLVQNPHVWNMLPRFVVERFVLLFGSM